MGKVLKRGSVWPPSTVTPGAVDLGRNCELWMKKRERKRTVFSDAQIV